MTENTNGIEAEPTVGDSIASLRASIESRQNAMAELASASAAHRGAVKSADAVLADAQRAAELLRVDMERTVIATTAEAHRRAQEVVASARYEAVTIREGAEEEAYRILAEAHAEAESLRRQAEHEMTLVQETKARDREELAAAHQDLLTRFEVIAQAVVASATHSAGEITAILSELPGPRAEAPEPSDSRDDAPRSTENAVEQPSTS